MPPAIQRLLVSQARKRDKAARVALEEIATRTENRDYVYPNRPYYHPRQPSVITTRNWLFQGYYVNCFCNPNNANWTPNRRESSTRTSAGTVRNAWRNRHRGTYFDTFPVAFTFQSGNIMPAMGNLVAPTNFAAFESAIENPNLPPGLDNFYRFWNLLDQPALGGVQANTHILVYHSRAFPTIWLEGFFDGKSFSFTESADNANQIIWSCTLIVQRMVPKISNYTLMRGLYSDWLYNSGALRDALPHEFFDTGKGTEEARIFSERRQQPARAVDSTAQIKSQPSRFDKRREGAAGTQRNPFSRNISNNWGNPYGGT
jgi:hypothetical protein